MINILLTALVPLFMACIFIIGLKPTKNMEKNLMNMDFTSVIKGLSALVVIFVHFPVEYTNPLQDAIGSFAYIAVTLFFLFSAYGMKFRALRKPTYISHFWRNRLAGLLIPNIVINLCAFILGFIFQISQWQSVAIIYDLNQYVAILLQYCVAFYIVFRLGSRYKWGVKTMVLILSVLITVSSIVTYFLTSKCEISLPIQWSYERMGLVWGLLILLFYDKISKWILSNTNLKSIILLFISLILGVAYLKFKVVWFFGEYLIKIVLGISIISFLILITSKFKIGNKVTLFLGQISYEIYLSHEIMMRVTESIAPNLSSGRFILATVVLTLSFSALIHMIDRRLVKLIKA